MAIMHYNIELDLLRSRLILAEDITIGLVAGPRYKKAEKVTDSSC